MSLLDTTKSRSSSPNSLERRSVVAGFWSVGETGISQALRLGSNLILTRILMPEAFGVMALVNALLLALNMFTDIGIRNSIIRSPRGEKAHYLRAAWSVQIVRSMVISACVVAVGIGLWLLAPLLAAPGTVYADPQLPFLIMMSSLVVVFQGLMSTNESLAMRRMSYGRLTLIKLLGQIFGLIVMVAFALVSHSVWALLSALLIGSLSVTVMSHIVLTGPQMRWAWDPEVADELWQFGKWLIGSSTFLFVQKNTDRIILAGLLEARAFGFYVIAILWVNVAVMLIEKLIQQVGFSGLSEVVNKRPDDLPKVFLKFTRVLDVLCIVGFIALLFGGPLLVAALYPPQYETSAYYLPFLAPLLLTKRFGIFGSLALVHGESRLMMLSSALNAAAMIGLLLLGYRLLGIEGVLLTVALAPLVSAPLFLHWTSLHLSLSVWRDVVWLFAICAVAVTIARVIPV